MTTDDRAPGARPEEDDESLGVFGSWRALYAAVLIYTFALVALLYLLTRALDHSIT
ncbi:MAG: hypothetical protein MJB57_14800 [Gemmatimonadetes bacterium]|nr:hypothetical protein [Gemmatimonadota bacterium]